MFKVGDRVVVADYDDYEGLITHDDWIERFEYEDTDTYGTRDYALCRYHGWVEISNLTLLA